MKSITKICSNECSQLHSGWLITLVAKQDKMFAFSHRRHYFDVDFGLECVFDREASAALSPE